MPKVDRKGDPVGGSKRPAAAKSSAKKNPFVQFELTDEQRLMCKSTAVDPDDIDAWMSRLLESGYKVSLKYDDYNQCFACFVVAPDADDPNEGLILSGRGSSPFKALKQAWFKDVRMLAGEWFKFSDNSQRMTIDD